MRENNRFMKRLAVFNVLVLVFLIGGMVYAKDYEVKKKAGGYDVEIRIDKSQPVVGENNIEIGIKDTSGKDVTDAQVRVEYSMPAMPGMPAMNYKTEAALKGYKYRATMNLSMSGSWGIVVKITRAGKITKVKFNVDAS